MHSSIQYALFSNNSRPDNKEIIGAARIAICA